MVASTSKRLSGCDDSGCEFAQELLNGDFTYAINFDRLQFNTRDNRYIIFEFLLCDERQFSRNITPFTSHPRRYWGRNKQKFISLWKAAQKLEAKLYLVNYSKAGTQYENQILVIEVLELDDTGIKREQITHFNRPDFSRWFREQNAMCRA